jgi:hypothetical protein
VALCNLVQHVNELPMHFQVTAGGVSKDFGRLRPLLGEKITASFW